MIRTPRLKVSSQCKCIHHLMKTQRNVASPKATLPDPIRLALPVVVPLGVLITFQYSAPVFPFFFPNHVSHHPFLIMLYLLLSLRCFSFFYMVLSPVSLSMSNLTVLPQALHQVDHQAPSQVQNRPVFLVPSHRHSRQVCLHSSAHSSTTMEPPWL